MKISSTKNCGEGKLKMLVYGEAGVGKTSLAKTIKEPTLIISAEAGLLCLADSEIDVIDISTNDEGVLIPEDRRMQRLAEVYKYLQEPTTIDKYKWVFIDSLTEVSQALIAKLNTEYPERKDSLVMYGENSKQLRSLIKAFRDLPHYNVVFTALPSLDKDENGSRYHGVNVIGKVGEALPAFFDEVFYMAVIETEEESKRVLYAQKNSKLVCKDRSGKLGKYEKPDLDLIARKIKGEL